MMFGTWLEVTWPNNVVTLIALVFLIGPFYILGPLRNSENALLVGMFSALGLILILTLGLTIYGLASFQDNGKLSGLESSKGWREFTSGFSVIKSRKI